MLNNEITTTRVSVRVLTFVIFCSNITWTVIGLLYIFYPLCALTTIVYVFSLAQWLVFYGILGTCNISLIMLLLAYPSVAEILFANFVIAMFYCSSTIMGTIKLLTDIAYCEQMTSRILFDTTLFALAFGYMTLFHQVLYLFRILQNQDYTT